MVKRIGLGVVVLAIVVFTIREIPSLRRELKILRM
jgi:hypothetical protein